jgi:hypothetical protein
MPRKKHKESLRNWILLLLFNSSCNYQWDVQEKTLSIPYIFGDEDGMFTSMLVQAISSSTGARVACEASQYRLEVALVKQQNEVIGYRQDPQKIRGKVRKEILADEGRRTLSVDVTLYKVGIEEPIVGPERLFARAEYDYVDGDSYQDLTFELNGKTKTVLSFSQGQLQSAEAAQEAAARPLYRQLSQKIVDLIATHW